MKFSFKDIEEAYSYVSMGSDLGSEAILCKDTGKIYYASEYDDENEIPEEVYDNDACISIPDKRDLDLGNCLVFDFVKRNMPEIYEEVRRMFRRRGAYSKYKDLLDEHGRLQDWYDFENERQARALREWCADHEIGLRD